MSRALEWHADLKSWVLVVPLRAAPAPAAASSPRPLPPVALALTAGPAASAATAATAKPPAGKTMALAALAAHAAHAGPDGPGNATHAFHQCFVDPVLPDTAERLVRRCQADTVRACAPNWTNQEVSHRQDCRNRHL